MPTAPSGRPDRSGSENARRAKLTKDDEKLLEDGVVDETDLDETDDELVDDSTLDESDPAEDDSADDDDEDDAATGTTLTKKRTRAAGSTATKARPGAKTKARRPKDQRTGNPFVALARFLREVVGEMRKVLWPTRRELVVYTIAVIIFVTVLIAIVGGLDFGFARLVLLVFG